MRNQLYQLPKIQFIGGESVTLIWNLWALSPNEPENKEQPFNANGCTVTFSVIDHLNKTGTPVISKKCTLRQGEDGVSSVAVTELSSLDTVNLMGTYIYQLTVQDIEGSVEIPGQGIIQVSVNVDRGLIGGSTNLSNLR